MKSINHVNPVILSKLFGLLVCLFSLSGCRQEDVQLPPFDGNRAFEEVVALVEYSPRDAGTPNGRKAAEHLAQRLKDFGLKPEIDTFVDATPIGKKTFHNVTARIPGKTDEWIILGSHFDTMPGIENFQGANDSGSSSGVLLEIARILAETKPNKGLIFAFFDGEEGIAGYVPGDGLHGSRHMAKKLSKNGRVDQIHAMILLDMVGDKDLHFTIPSNSSRTLIQEVLKAAHATGHRNRFSLSLGTIITDDHQPFLDIGIAAIDLIDFRFGSQEGLNDLWHTENDNLESISENSLQITGDITIKLLQSLAFKEYP